MKERGILYSAPMVLAKLAKRKTQTRRIIKASLIFDLSDPYDAAEILRRCPYGAAGDRLWTRETWRLNYASGVGSEVEYRADGATSVCPVNAKYSNLLNDDVKHDRWRPSIFMPRWASRLLDEIVSVRIEQLQEISETDALAEGVTPGAAQTAVEAYGFLWERINGDGSWEENPWVWRIETKELT